MATLNRVVPLYSNVKYKNTVIQATLKSSKSRTNKGESLQPKKWNVFFL